MSWRTARPHPGSGRPRGAAPGARAKAHSGSARSPARPPRASRSPAARPGRGSSSPQTLLPPNRWPPASREQRARGPQGSRPRPRALGSGRRPGLSARGDARAGYLQPPGNRAPTRPVPETGASRASEGPSGLRLLLASARCRRLGDERVRGFSVVPPQSLRRRPLPRQTLSGLPAGSTSSPPSLLPLTSVHLSSSCQKLQGEDGQERTS